ncbi:MAG: polymer-forming cytoskeletal protein [Treponema sp.]|uniref:bactofilin family protein n=1 Tax=Treponema sp. TaxID=166 RepID=UPI00298D74E3|nr:polymer-forming cytoskeletal protein [Treponema sp.]MBR5932957.1 polymer-forming cytoskeletal protein [Treponema sp.]
MYDNKGCDLLDFDESDFNTVMASDITFSGKIRFTKPFMIKGNVSGKIEADSDLVIAQDAVVKADITAERILVRGKVEGNINGNTMVFVTSNGSVDGDITSKQVVLEPGSNFTGRCTMVKENEA